MWFIVFTYMRVSEVRKFSHRTLRVILFKVKILWLVKFVMFVTWQKKPHTVRWCGYHYTHTHPFNGPLSGTIQVSQFQKGKTNLDFTDARHSEWQWHQLGRMQVCTSLQTDNLTSTHPFQKTLSFLQAGCPSCHPTHSVKALKARCSYH